MRKNIEQLIKSGVTAYQVSQDTGLSRNPLQRLWKGDSQMDNLTLKSAEILSNYWEELIMIKIERKRKYEHIIGEEFERTYGEFELDTAAGDILHVVDEFEAYHANNSVEMDDWQVEEVEAVEQMKNGSYSFDCGDFVYYVEIKKEMNEMEIIKNIKRIIEEIENGTIELENLDPNYHEIEYIDGASDHYIIHEVEGQEGLEVFFAEHDHVKEVRDDVYENGKDEVEEFEKLTINEYADQYDYDEVVAYRYDGGEINWI